MRASNKNNNPRIIGTIERDGGAVRARPLRGPDSIAVETSLPEGAVVEVVGGTVRELASPESALAQIYAILSRHALDPVPSPEVAADVAELVASPGLDDRVVDRTALPFVTIDNHGSLDLDQALFIEADGDGHVVHYAVADASYYVRPDTVLFEEALRRGSSCYLPGLMVPMLPVELSEGLISLNPDVPRRALLMSARLDSAGEVVAFDVERARIHSRAKLTYPGVQDFHDRPSESPLADQPYSESLRLLREVGERRIARARRAGVIQFERSEAEIDIDDPTDTHFRIDARDRNDVERWNEQISLLCNTEGGRLLDRHGRLTGDLQSVFRVHLPPLPERLADLEERIGAIVEEHGLSGQWCWKRDEDLADYLDNLPRATQTDRVRQAIDRQVRYVFQPAQFAEAVGPHSALGVDAYARLTAPMREIVGVFTHKELLEALGLERPRDRSADEDLRHRVVKAGNAAKKLQRRLDKEVGLLAIEQLFRSDLRREREARPSHIGTVLGLRPSRLYVALDGFPLDLKVYSDDLSRRWRCEFSHVGESLVPTSPDAPTFRVGSCIELVAHEYDADRRRFRFDVALASVPR